MTEFVVKPRAKPLILRRCERTGEIHPSELGRLLAKLKSGIPAKEIALVVEEYEIGLEAAHEEELDSHDYSSRAKHEQLAVPSPCFTRKLF